ncbi:hypothetical protein BCR39DRAFT_513034 [Naematelia encephala]|uniref:Glycosyltransferase 61 catalytic domain-containing protein n=1 Tax=Naematelia encephala TaxID=71784 RepID=A0A1Y2BMU5_9TREE|nr:hypothetical protein BCR39DRAFT_513034 [Naematelia encephala]
MPLARNISRTLVSCSCIAAFLYFFTALSEYLNLHDLVPSGLSEPSTTYTLRSRDESTRVFRQDLKTTKFLSHAPGFSVVENLYWRNYTYYILTDQPWETPHLRYFASLSFDTQKTEGTLGILAAEIWAIRGDPIAPNVLDKDPQFGTSISFDEAVKKFGKAIELESPMLINDDDNFVNHMYHWIGETFIGAWRIWSSYAWRTGLVLPDFKTVAFIRQWHCAEKPEGHGAGDCWEDYPGANKWFTQKFFPGIKIESRTDWEARADTLQIYRLPLVVIADRAGGHNGPFSAWKPWGDVFRLPVMHDWLTQLRDRVLAGYTGRVNLRPKDTGRLRVMYLERQEHGRSLRDEDHDRLVEALEQLHKERVVDVVIETFTSAIPFADQVAKISTIDILIGVHGNGLTHTIWMNPGNDKAVFEMQPAACTITDYSPLAVAAGVQHYMVHETTFCHPVDCPQRGCTDHENYPDGINSDDIRVTPSVITNEIRKIAQRAAAMH